jgi:hypothetical protein
MVFLATTPWRFQIHNLYLAYGRANCLWKNCLCVILLAMPNTSNAGSVTPATLESLDWMVGGWTGSLGPQRVEESWSLPHMGSMETMIRLSNPDGVQMIELIVIREVTDEQGNPSLMLHLRQFSPALELRTDQDMQLDRIAEHEVSFIAEGEASVPRLAYELLGPGHLQVHVTIVTGDVVSAELHATP